MHTLTVDQGLLFGIIVILFMLLLWGRIRYDLIAFGVLVVAVIVGVGLAAITPANV